jgi:hypothetical protein
MNRWILVGLLSGACSWGGGVAPATRLVFVETPSAWRIVAAEESGHQQIALIVGEHTLDVGTIEGACVPRVGVPFTEVSGQKAFAALACTNPDGEAFDFVLVEILPDETDWPYPVALASVVTRVMEDDKIMMRSLGPTEIPLGVVPVPPRVESQEAETSTDPPSAEE